MQYDKVAASYSILLHVLFTTMFHDQNWLLYFPSQCNVYSMKLSPLLVAKSLVPVALEWNAVIVSWTTASTLSPYHVVPTIQPVVLWVS
jgi:hypothetical protein